MKYTNIIQAVENNNLKEVKAMIIADFNLDVQDKDRDTALMKAAYCGKYDMVKLLIEAGACLDITDSYQNTALTLAANNNHIEVAKLLVLSGAKTTSLSLSFLKESTDVQSCLKQKAQKRQLETKKAPPIKLQRRR